MADYQAIGAMTAPIKAPDTFGQLSSILGVAQQSQQLQQQAQVLQQQKLATQQQKGLSDFFTSWSPGDHVGADGTMDIDSAHGSDAYKALPGNARAAVDEKLISIKSGQLTNAKSLLDLSGSARDYVAQGLGGLDTDPDVIAGNDNGKAKVQAALKQVSDTGGAPAAKFALTYQKMTDGDLKPGDLPQRIGALQKSALNASQQIQLRTPQPTAVQGKEGLNFINTNPNAPQPVGSQIGQTATDQGIAPGWQVVNGQLVRTGNAGLSVPKGPPSTTAPPSPGKLPAYPRPQLNADPGEVERYNKTMNDNREHVSAISGAANDIQNGVGATRFRNSQISDILHRQISNNAPDITGPGADTLHWVASHLPGAQQFSTDYDTLMHYQAQNSAALARTMGVPNTNAGADIAGAAAGSTHQKPQALLEVTKTNDAMNSALDMYNSGLAKVSNNGADLSKVSAFKNAWGKNFDVNAVRYDDALRNNDHAEIDRIKKTLGPEGMKVLGAHYRILHSLSETGDLP